MVFWEGHDELGDHDFQGANLQPFKALNDAGFSQEGLLFNPGEYLPDHF